MRPSNTGGRAIVVPTSRFSFSGHVDSENKGKCSVQPETSALKFTPLEGPPPPGTTDNDVGGASSEDLPKKTSLAEKRLGGKDPPLMHITIPSDEGGERIPLCEQHSPLALYEQDYDTQGQKIGQMLRKLSVYNATEATSAEADAKPKAAAAKMGTIMGVFLPCLQNIFGVLFFIRLAWIIGTAGILQAFFVVLTCVSVTFLTSISLSAIATNGVVPSGGPYYMISRNLGPELGGAIGILFYLGTTIAASMYITGAVEIMLLYLWPEGKIFDSLFNNYRLYGSVLLVALSLIVLAGVKVVNKFALPLVFVVVFCIFSAIIGAFIRWNGSDSLQFCMVGDRPADLSSYFEKTQIVPNCTADGLAPIFCNANGTCDPYYNTMKNIKIWRASNKPAIRNEPVIKGIASGVFFENLWPKYLRAGEVLSKDRKDKGDINRGGHPSYIYAESVTNFMILVGVFFPSATGIMAGSNRSGNLRDAAQSIPRGTLTAQIFSSCVYLTGVVLFGSTVSEMFIRDKYGRSAMGKLIISEVAYPFPFVILVGCFMSTIGAGMQSLTGAPRLLQAIAADDVLPFLKPFRKMDKRGEPIRAILLTLLICWCGILIAVIENITALITQFFLMCYLGVNTACALQSLLKSPGWRPGFRYFHWSLSMVGAILCVVVMFISAWHFALFAIFIGAAVYKYIEYAGAEKEWGDGIRGLGLSAARFALLNLDDKPQHSRNWRPQLLVITGDTDSQHTQGLLSFVSQLKAGKGLTLVAHCIEGEFTRDHDQAAVDLEKLKALLKKNKIKGFSDVLIAENFIEGISCLVQTSGLGGMRHNTVALAWPERWNSEHQWHIAHRFVSSIRSSTAAGCAIMVAKYADKFPASSTKVSGFIDVWWVVHDGGLLMLLPFLLRQHKTWKNTTVRLFAIAQMEDNNVQMKADLEKFLYHLRIEAQVFVIEMTDSDISDYTYERTMKMEERSKLLRNMNKADREKDIQTHLEQAVTRERKLSKINEEASAPVTQRLEAVTEHAEEQPASVTSPTKSDRGVRFSEDESSVEPKTGNGTLEKDSEEKRRKRRYNVHKMHTAVKLGEMMREKSAGAQLVIVNLPGPPDPDSDTHYMDFIEALTEGLDRVLLVRGTGAEVVTIYS
ncbi:unnamed protein product [Caenorhabditis auriculariae]|uniref:Uncharacterized protein n=1 Tax=Caenorhabditis auriculariae TaxID=2777116 RepID=A0A8S1HEY1_9PELO|nr:unnamed protein product [Caenorhabditis auriculariae]